MYYTRIHGHFNFEFLYDEVVNKFDSGATFVEIGAYLGKSTCYLSERILASKKSFKFYVIDNWIGHPSDVNLAKEIKELGGDVYDKFESNMKSAGVFNILNTIRGDSSESADRFSDNSVDFVFIDAAHDRDSVKKDISAWLPKVKKGGILAGHDYGNKETAVKEVVDEFFGDRVKVIDNTWILYL